MEKSVFKLFSVRHVLYRISPIFFPGVVNARYSLFDRNDVKFKTTSLNDNPGE